MSQNPNDKQRGEDVEPFDWRLGCARPHSPVILRLPEVLRCTMQEGGPLLTDRRLDLR